MLLHMFFCTLCSTLLYKVISRGQTFCHTRSHLAEATNTIYSLVADASDGRRNTGGLVIRMAG